MSSCFPSPDDTCWILNLVMEKGPSDGWRSWIEPLSGSVVGGLPDPYFAAEAADPDAARLATFNLVREHCSGLDALAQNEFHLRFATPMKFRDVPPVEWPPKRDTYRKLDAIKSALKSGAQWPALN